MPINVILWLLIKVEKDSLKIAGEVTTESKEENFLGVIIDKGLSLNSYVAALCKKTNQKLHALSRISNNIDRDILRQIMKAF